MQTRRASNSSSWSRPSTLRDERVRAGDAPTAREHAHVHAVHALAHAAALVQGDGPRPGERAAQVDRRVALHEVEPVLLGARHLEHRVGGREQRLRRDRVGHRAVPAERQLLDQRHLAAHVRGRRGGGVSGGSAAKDDELHRGILRSPHEPACLHHRRRRDPRRLPVDRRRPRLPRQPRRHPGAPVGLRGRRELLPRLERQPGRAVRHLQASDRILAEARSEAAAFLGAASGSEIVFGANMTTLTMHASRILFRGLGPGDEVLVTGLDHDANVAPWMLAASDRGVTVRQVGIDPESCLVDVDDFASKLSGRHARGRLRLGLERRRHHERRRPARARSAARPARSPTSTPSTTRRTARSTSRAVGCDFLVCSAYKFFGPHVGILFGRARAARAAPPVQGAAGAGRAAPLVGDRDDQPGGDRGHGRGDRLPARAGDGHASRPTSAT